MDGRAGRGHRRKEDGGARGSEVYQGEATNGPRGEAVKERAPAGSSRGL